MTTLLKPFSVRSELLKRNLRVFTPREFGRLFHTTPDRTKYFVEEHTNDALRDLAHKFQTTELNVRREYVQHLFLSYFYQQPQTDKIYWVYAE